MPWPPGTTRTSRAGASAKVWSGRTRRPLAHRIGRSCSAIVTTRSPSLRGHREDLPRSDEVELLGAVEQQDAGRDPHLGPPRSPRRWRTEAAAVVGRGDAHGAQERPAHGLGGAEAAAGGDRPRRRRRTPRAGAGPPRPAPARRSGPASRRSRRRKTRAKCRGLIAARRGERARPTGRAARWSAIQAWTSVTSSRSAVWVASVALNCAWPPGRLRNTTSWRATGQRDRRARGPPRPARAQRSMPAVTPGGGGDVAVAHEDRVGFDRRRAGKRAASWSQAPSGWWRAGRRADRPPRGRTRRSRRTRPGGHRRGDSAPDIDERRDPRVTRADVLAAGDDEGVDRARPSPIPRVGVRVIPLVVTIGPRRGRRPRPCTAG